MFDVVILIMEDSDYFELLSKNEVENKSLELKRIDKIKAPNGMEEILKLIVGMANRSGGYILIGINDDGTPEGNNIFDCFSQGDKSGIDKIKEKIINLCLEKISPIINIDLDICSGDDYEFLSIIVPRKNNIPHAYVKKSDGKIKHRDYYIKNSHSCTLVSDSQLEWLFNSKNYENKIDYYPVQVTTYKFMGGIPIASGLGRLGDWLIIQPEVTREAAQVMHDVFDHGENIIEKLKESTEYRIELFSEILLHTIIRTIDGYGSRCIPKDAKFLPYFPDDFLLSKILGDNSKTIFEDIFKNKISYPDKTKVEFFKEKNNVVNCRFYNDHCNIKISLFMRGFKAGIPGNNPYFSIMLSTHWLDFQNKSENEYESYEFLVSVEIERKFPEVFDNVYYDSELFCERIRNSLKSYWDMEYFLKEQYPHYRKLYSIDYKLDQLLNAQIKQSKG